MEARTSTDARASSFSLRSNSTQKRRLPPSYPPPLSRPPPRGHTPSYPPGRGMSRPFGPPNDETPDPLPSRTCTRCVFMWETLYNDYPFYGLVVVICCTRYAMRNHTLYKLLCGRRCTGAEGGATAEFGFQRARAGGNGRARRDDGVCLSAS